MLQVGQGSIYPALRRLEDEGWIAAGWSASASAGRSSRRPSNVTPLDAATFAGSAALLLATAVAASFYPAWRAAPTDPIGALRED